MQKYYLGLDIGTNSCGWAVTDEGYNLLRAKGKDLWGVRLFEEAKTAEERRQKRTERRRRDRQKLKLSWLRDIFSKEIEKVDKDFLTRIKYSNLWEEDKQAKSLQGKDSLFHGFIEGKPYTDKNYFKDYKTIYHLRSELTQKPAKDIRLLYLALHNIIKHRGHFLYSGDFGNNSDILDILNRTISQLNKLNEESNLFCLSEIGDEQGKAIIECLKDKKGLRETKNQFIQIFNAKSKMEKAFVSTIVDGKLSLSQILQVSVEDDKIDFCSDTCDEKIMELSGIIEDDALSAIQSIKESYSVLRLKSILGEHQFICDALVESYNIHSKQLEELKAFVKKYYPDQYNDLFRNSRDKTSDDSKVGYAQYVNGNLVNGKKQIANMNASHRDRDLFYKYIKSILSNTPKNVENQEMFESERNNILNSIENDSFLLKQRSKSNTVFPNKLYEKELKRILEVNASKYTFLDDKDAQYGLTNSDKIISILNFKVEYFVGPIGENPNGQKHGWATKVANLDYKPWTLEKIVDFNVCEDEFIGKMTNKCTYLKDKDVLPKHSIMYSKFRVLNELNNLKIDGNPISLSLKQKIFNDLFTKEKKVTIKKLKNFLLAEGVITKEEINAIQIGGIDKEFANNYSSYVKFASDPLFGKEFTDKYINEIEKIIKYHTIISDKNRLAARIKKEFANIFNDKQIEHLKGLNFSDWGRLSSEFLMNLKFVNNKTGEITCVLDEMWNTNNNLQQLFNKSDYTLSDQLNEIKQKNIKDLVFGEIEELYCSPAVKRSIWQTLKIVKEVVEVMGQMPEKVFVEVTRDDEEKGDAGRKLSRKNNLEGYYKSKSFKNNVFVTSDELASLLEELNKKEISNKLRSEKVYLYFLQAGKCAYSGQPINIDDIFNENLYDVDHIIPKGIIKDDSINNKVLVKSGLNRDKDMNYPLPIELQMKQKNFWKSLLEIGLMSQEKYDRLMRSKKLDDEEIGNFVARQLVETNQSVKSVIDCLKGYMDNPRKIVYSKARFVSEFRNQFGLIKCRTINDLHHAQDAYLNIIVGNVLNARFTDDPRNFYRSKNRNASLTKNTEKLFNGIVYSPMTGDAIWDVNRDIERVSKTCEKTSCLISNMNFSNINGAYYKETIHKKTKGNSKSEAAISLKGDLNNPISNVEKYGGYNDLNNSYFMVVESKDKKGKTIRTIVAVPILVVQKYIGKPNYQQNILDYVAKENNLIEPSIVLDKINIMSTLKIGGGEYYLGGKSGDAFSLHNGNQLYLNNKFTKYMKIIEKYLQIIKNKNGDGLTQDDKMILVSKASKYGNQELKLTSQENIEFYQIILEKLNSQVYHGMQLNNNLLPKLINKKETFEKLTVQEQVQVLYNIIRRLTRGANNADLSLLGEGTAIGKLTIGKNISEKNVVLIERSTTGLFEKRIKL